MSHLNSKILIKKLLSLFLCHCVFLVHIVGCGNASQLMKKSAEDKTISLSKTENTFFTVQHSTDPILSHVKKLSSDSEADRLADYYGFPRENFIYVGSPNQKPEPDYRDPNRDYAADRFKDVIDRSYSDTSRPVSDFYTKQKIGHVILDESGGDGIGAEGTLVYTNEYAKEMWTDHIVLISEGETFFTENQVNQFRQGTATIGVRVVYSDSHKLKEAPGAHDFFIDLTQKPIQNGRPALPSQMNGDFELSNSGSKNNTLSTTNYIQGPTTPVITGTPSTNVVNIQAETIKNEGGAGQVGQSIVSSTTTTMPEGATRANPSENPRGLPSKSELALSNSDKSEQLVTKLQEQAKLWADNFSKDAIDLSAKAEATSTKITELINTQIETSNNLASQVVETISLPAWMDTIPDTSVASNYLPSNNIRYPGSYFETDADTEFGKELQDADRYLRTTRDIVNSASNTDPKDIKNTKNSMLDVAEININLADMSSVEGNQLEAKAHLEMALNITDTVLDFTPGISLVKDIVSLTTGFNPVTGEELSAMELSFIAVGLFVPSAVSATAKRFEKLTSSFSKLVARSERYQRYSTYIQDILNKVSGRVAKAKLEVSKYVGDIDIASARWGDYVVKDLPRLLAFPDIPSVLDKWGMSSIEKGGGNQLLEHLFSKTYDIKRWAPIEKKIGFNEGKITDSFTKKDLFSMKKGISAIDEITEKMKTEAVLIYEKAEPEIIQRYYFKTSVQNSNDSGLKLIETNGKFNTIMPMGIVNFEKDALRKGFKKIK